MPYALYYTLAGKLTNDIVPEEYPTSIKIALSYVVNSVVQTLLSYTIKLKYSWIFHSRDLVWFFRLDLKRVFPLSCYIKLDHVWTQDSPMFPLTVGGNLGPYIDQWRSTLGFGILKQKHKMKNRNNYIMYIYIYVHIITAIIFEHKPLKQSYIFLKTVCPSVCLSVCLSGLFLSISPPACQTPPSPHSPNTLRPPPPIPSGARFPPAPKQLIVNYI